MWTVVTDMCTIANIAWKWMSLGTTSSTGCCAHEGVFRSRRSAQRAKNGCALRTRCPQKWRAGARPGGLSFFLSSLPLFLFSLSLFPYLPPPFLGRAGGRGNIIPRAGALRWEMRCRRCQSRAVASVHFSFFLSLSLFFSLRSGVTMSPSALARLLRRCGWQRHRPRPDSWSPSVSLVLSDVSLSSLSLFLSLCLSFFLYFPLFSLKAERDDDTPGFARLRR